MVSIISRKFLEKIKIYVSMSRKEFNYWRMNWKISSKKVQKPLLVNNWFRNDGIKKIISMNPIDHLDSEKKEDIDFYLIDNK